MNQRYTSTLLTHFIGRGTKKEAKRYELFKSILESGYLLSRSVQRLEPAKLDDVIGNRGFGYPMDFPQKTDLNEIITANVVCFADIPFSDLSVHTQKYSRFGIAFEKNFLITKGASPVFYVCANAIDPQMEKLQQRNPAMAKDVIYLKSVFRNGMKALVNSWKDQIQKRNHSKKTIPSDEMNRIFSECS